jgi:hydroxymethylbilane synthase
VDAAVLAAAGLSRLGLAPANARSLPLAMMVPAPGQGCLAVQARDDDDDTIAAVAPLDHAASHRALDAERSLMWRLGGGCSLPLGAHATIGVESVSLTAVIATADGTPVLRVETEGATPEDAAAAAAKELIGQGAERILAEVGAA